MVTAPSTGLPDAIEDLVHLAVRGDEHAFARIVRLHHADMAGVCFVVCGDVHLAQEAVAAAWPVAWRRLGRLRDSERLVPWLCGVAADEACRRIHRSDGRGAVEVLAGARSTGAPADRSQQASDPDLAVALAGLEPEDRALLALRYVAGLSCAELERAIGVPAPDVRLGALLGRLGRDVGEAQVDPDQLAMYLEQRLRAYAAIQVRPVDADSVARATRAEMLIAGSYLPSVVIAALVAALFMAAAYVVGSSTPAPIAPANHAPVNVHATSGAGLRWTREYAWIGQPPQDDAPSDGGTAPGA